MHWLKHRFKIKTGHNQGPGVLVTDYFINIYTDYEPLRVAWAIFVGGRVEQLRVGLGFKRDCEETGRYFHCNQQGYFSKSPGRPRTPVKWGNGFWDGPSLPKGAWIKRSRNLTDNCSMNPNGKLIIPRVKPNMEATALATKRWKWLFYKIWGKQQNCAELSLIANMQLGNVSCNKVTFNSNYFFSELNYKNHHHFK